MVKANFMKHASTGWVVLLALASGACDSGGHSGLAWSQFALCVAGEGVTEPAQLPSRLRSIELRERQPPASGDNNSHWPDRCAPFADALYLSLGSSAEQKLLERALSRQLGCKEGADAPGCHFPSAGAALTDATALWQAAQAAGLQVDPAVQGERPKHDLAFEDAGQWNALASKEHELAGSTITRAGTLRLLFKSRTAGQRVCEVKGASVQCAAVSAAVPALSYQSISLLPDDAAIISGLTPEGRQAFFAESGQVATFYGTGSSAQREGMLVEEGETGQGFVAVLGAAGKKRGEAKIETQAPKDNPPVGVGNWVSWLEGSGPGASWHVASVAGKTLKRGPHFDGEFAGYLRPCNTASGSSVGLWGRSQGERDAKATAGKGETAVWATFLQDGAWIPPVTAIMPFDRKLTNWRCAGESLGVFWAKSQGPELAVGAVTCDASGCRAEQSQWPGLGVQRWLFAGDVGGKFVAIWTTELGDTRRRVGSVKDFASADERVLFEDPDRGGPVFSNAQTFFAGDDAYLLVFDKGPVLLRVDAQGGLTSLAAP